jgi:chaperonin GroEL
LKPVSSRAAAQALLLATQAVEKESSENADIHAGINIIRRALEAPLRQIAENAGVEGSIVVGKVLDGKGKIGFDAQNEVYCDLIGAGIVDPAKVVTTALRDAASVAGLLITTEAMVAEKPGSCGCCGSGHARYGWHGWYGRHDVSPNRFIINNLRPSFGAAFFATMCF